MLIRLGSRRRLAAAALVLALATPALPREGADRQPIYIGARACAKCHTGLEVGHAFSIWRRSPHARAWAALWSAQARQIARLSGIPEAPHEAKQCLGCHATAADVEEWEREESFRLEDGLQCEKCHGPGSEYAQKKIMRDLDAAVARGLVIPDRKESCRMCHRPKGSHEAVLHRRPFELEWAWKEIGHPRPKEEDPRVAEQEEIEEPRPDRDSGETLFTGASACGACHRGPKFGFQLSRWRSGPHARAWATLASPRAYEIAEKTGLKGVPQQRRKCLRCHSTGSEYRKKCFQDGFDVTDGVQCESCHGAGSAYSPEAVMLDLVAARRAGLREVTRETCLGCHESAHGKPFDYDEALEKIRHPSTLPSVAAAPRYKTPLNVALRPGAPEIWAACEAGDCVVVVDTNERRKVAEIAVGGQPHDVTFDHAGRRAFVTNRLDDNLSVIDAERREVVETIPVGDEPHGVLLDSRDEHLYVLNTSLDNISVLDAHSYREIKRLTASRSPWSLALSPDGSRLLVTNALSRFVKPRTPTMSEVTVIDTELAVVEDRVVVPASNLIQGVAWHPDGAYALVTLNRTKNLVPMTRLLQGWTVTNGLGVIWRDGRVDQVLLDQPDTSFPDPADVAITPDGKRALVTSSGSNRVAVVDLAKLTSMLAGATERERERIFPNHLGKPTEFIEKLIPVSRSPRGILCTPDGREAWVVNALSDSLTVVDLQRLEAVAEVDLGGAKEITRVRRGEIVFHSANIAFHRQFSCHTCHPDGHVDGITYDIEPDGIGVNPVDNRTLRGILDMAPFKWSGLNKTLQRQCGPRLAVFFTRIAPFSPDDLAALENYICTIPRPPNRYRALGTDLSPAQRRGRVVFFRTRTNGGREVPRGRRCTHCHPPPLYTDGRRHDVGTKSHLDNGSRFDAPHLGNIYDSAPYLHDGRARTLEEIWTRFNPYDQHGVTNDLTKDQLNDLIEYLKTL